MRYPKDGVRKCIYSMMGISTNGKLPRAFGGGTYWEVVYTPSEQPGEPHIEEHLLRPDWERPWSDNKRGWSFYAVSRVKTHGHSYSTSLSPERLAETPRDVIEDAIRVVFKGMVRNWKLQEDDDGEAKKKERNRLQKIKNRKKLVCMPEILTE